MLCRPCTTPGINECGVARRSRRLRGALSVHHLLEVIGPTVSTGGHVITGSTVGGVSHIIKAVVNDRVSGGCNTRNLPRSAVRLAFIKSTKRDFNTFVPGKVALALRNSSGSCVNGNLSNNGVVMHMPGRTACTPRRGVVANGITFCNTADNGTCVGNVTKRQFYIQGDKISTMIRKVNSRKYRCVANKAILVVNGAKHGFTTKVSNKMTCVLSFSRGGLGVRVIDTAASLGSARRSAVGHVLRRRVVFAKDPGTRGVLTG